MAGGDIDWTCVQCKIVQDGGTKKMKGKRHLITLFLGTCTGSQILEPLLNHGQSDRMWQIKWCSVMLYMFQILSHSSHKTTDHCRFVSRDAVVFPECVARAGFPFHSGGLGAEGVFATVRNRSQPSATVRNRSQPFVWGPYGRAYGKFCRRCHFWRFPTFRCFVSRGRRGTLWHSDVFCNVSKVVLCGRRNTFATFSEDAWQFSWQAQHFGRVHRHFAWQAQYFRRVVSSVFLQIALAGLRQVATRGKFRGRRGILWDVLKIDGSLARNIDFEVADLEVPKKTRRKTSVLKLQSVKIGRSLARNARFGAPTCLVSRHWFSVVFAVSMGEAAKHVLPACFKLWKVEEVSHEMLVLMFLRVSSRVSGFPVASPCLWGKLQNVSFSKISKQVVMSFCLAGKALCDIPTCLITSRKYQNWRKSRTKCSFFCTHVSRPESLVFLWRRCGYGGSSALHTLHFTLYAPHSTLYTPHSTLYTLHSTLHTLHYTFHSSLLTPHFPLLTPHFTHSTLYTPHSTLYTPHCRLVQ